MGTVYVGTIGGWYDSRCLLTAAFAVEFAFGAFAVQTCFLVFPAFAVEVFPDFAVQTCFLTCPSNYISTWYII